MTSELPRKIQALHVEDDPMQQKLIAHFLKRMPGYDFTVVTASDEESGVQSFLDSTFDIVFLDYHLAEGNGMSCLQRIRSHDPIVPILAISGVATNDVAAELVQVGADDYLNKRELNSETLAQTVDAMIKRSDLLKMRMPKRTSGQSVGASSAELFASAANCMQQLLPILEKMEKDLLGKVIDEESMQLLFDNVCGDWNTKNQQGPDARLIFRPVFLELAIRLLHTDSEGDL